MAERVNAAQRIQLQNVAEREVMRFAGDHLRWHKHIHNVELDPMQVLKCVQMDEHPNTLDYSCRRTGKTAIKEMYLLKFLATQADQELGIVAPRQAQSQVNLRYHTEAIQRSQILTAWIGYRRGRRQLGDTAYAFSNKSRAEAYGIMAQVDGGDLTAASLEEVDDMPHDRLFSNFLLMMGATRRLGASTESANDPQIRITGVHKGADTLSELVNGGQYHVLPTVDAYLGMEMGILNEAFMLQMRNELSPDEYIRQLLCLPVSARRLVWESWVRKALQTGLAAGLELADPIPGGQYKKRGLIGFGYDAAGHGENPLASRHAFVVVEQIGNYLCPIYARTWPAGTDDSVVMRDLIGYWEYFQPDQALGDAYGVGMLTQLCDELLRRNLTQTDRRAIGDGASVASTWQEWPFAPTRMEGQVKHNMAQSVRALYNNRQAACPYIDDYDLNDPSVADYRLLLRQLVNIEAVANKTGTYSSYKMANAKLGDDLFDALCFATWGMITRGAAPSAVITSSKRSRASLLGAPVIRLPSDPIQARLPQAA